MSADDTTDMDEQDTVFVERPGGFEQVPDGLWLVMQNDDDTAPKPHVVSSGAVVMYLALSKHGAKETRGVPGRPRLSRSMGVSTKTVDNRINELIEKGWLLITPRFRPTADQRQTSNHYRLLWTPIQSNDDPRLVKHRRDMETFEELMAARQATNARKREGTPGHNAAKRPRSVRAAAWVDPREESVAGVPPAETPDPPREGFFAPPAKNPSPQDSYLLGLTQVPTEPSSGNSLRSLPAGSDVEPDATLIELPVGTKARKPRARRPPSPHAAQANEIVTAFQKWYEDKQGTPLTRKREAFHALVTTCVVPALEAGYDVAAVKMALAKTDEHWPHPKAFERELVTASGGKAAQARGAQGRHEREMARHKGYGEGERWKVAIEAAMAQKPAQGLS